MRQVPSWPPVVNGVPVPYEAPLDELAQMLDCSDTVEVAARALAHDGSPESLGLLRPLLHDNAGDWRRRQAAVEALGMHPLGGEEAARVIELLDDPIPHVVWAASLAAASLGLTQAVPHLLAALDSSERFVASGAHNALFKLQQPGDTKTLIDKYRTGDYERRKSIGTLIAVRVRPRSWRDVYEPFKVSDVAEHRELACRIAHAFGGTEVRSDLEVLASDSDGHVRGAARRALAAIEARGGTEGFGGMDPDEPVSAYDLGRGSRR